MQKANRNGRKSKIFSSDITVHDYADANPRSHSRLRVKKSSNTTVSALHKQDITKVMANSDEVAWYDKDLDDFDITIDRVCDDPESLDDESVLACSRKTTPTKRQKKQSLSEGGVTYPIDLWFQLSRYIHPESVKSFALICRGTRSVIQTVQFWKTTYLRFYTDDKALPVDLRRDNLECIHGLRGRVIQTLFYIYPPLVSRSKTTVPFENEPHVLVGHRCLLTWHKRVKNVWNFCFKFRKGDQTKKDSNSRRGLLSKDFEAWHQDLFYNPNDRCQILEVTCSNFNSAPVVMGLILNRVYLNVSSGSMRYHKLKLIFDTHLKTTTSKTENGMYEVVLDPVLEVRVYPWWHPKYREAHNEQLEAEEE